MIGKEGNERGNGEEKEGGSREERNKNEESLIEESGFNVFDARTVALDLIVAASSLS